MGRVEYLTLVNEGIKLASIEMVLLFRQKGQFFSLMNEKKTSTLTSYSQNGRKELLTIKANNNITVNYICYKYLVFYNNTTKESMQIFIYYY